MAIENIINTVDGSSSKQEPANTIEAKAIGDTFKNTAQTNNDDHLSQDAHLYPEQSQADGTLLIPADTPKPTEDATPVEQASASVEADTNQLSTEDTTDEPSAGDKRGYNPTITSAKSVAESTTEPASKKQKITDKNDTNGRVTDESTSAVVQNGASHGSNGEKKTRRSRKVKEAVKKAIPTDGIGSRTRSRTKTTS